MVSILLWMLLVLTAFVHGKIEKDSNQSSDDPLENQYGRIQHAAVIMRHGDRSPVSSYPLDPHKNYPWPQGFGQLTNEGKRRSYDLGKWFKLRYRTLVSETYKRELILVHSGGKDRFIMSAQCFLFGFYPADGSEMWNKDEKWQPIPVHTIPLEYDNMIHITGRRCRRLNQVSEASYNGPKVVKVLTDHAETIRYIEKSAGINSTNMTNAQIVSMLRSLSTTLTIQNQNNLTLPGWTAQVYPEPLETIISETIHSEVYDPTGTRLAAGPMLKSLTFDMEQKTKTTDFKQNLHIYSGSDTILEAVMIALDVYNHMRPHFGSALIFELRKKNNNSLVTISYKNSTANAPSLLSVPGCQSPCTLEKFLNLTKPMIPEDWSKECEISSSFSAVVMPNNWCLLLVVIYRSFR